MATVSARLANFDLSAWPHWRAVRDGLTLAGLLYIAAVWAGIAPYAPPVPEYGPMIDGRGYWAAWQGGLYDIPWTETSAYVYSPAFAQVLWPATLLPWPVFAAGWTVAAIGCLFWMRVPWMLAFPGVIDDILRGNIHVFLAAAVVIGFRYSSSWAFMLLTKVTPGIGVLWFAARRQWRKLAFAIGATAVIAGLSFAVTPSLWTDWFDLLRSSTGESPGIKLVPLPLVARLPVAAVLVVFAARTDRAWLLPVAVMLALPNVWTSSTALLAGAVALWLVRDGDGDPDATPSAQST
jgi:Glycosyltransferase family 87